MIDVAHTPFLRWRRMYARLLQGVRGAIVALLLTAPALALEPGEEFQSFQSNRPSPAFTGFLAALERDIAQGVLPYEFVSDPTKAGSASIRLISAKAGRVFGKYQTVMITTLCHPTWGYVIGQAIANGEPQHVAWAVERADGAGCPALHFIYHATAMV